MSDTEHNFRPKLPPWIRVRVPCGAEREHVEALLKVNALNTVCRGAQCPNLCECWHRGTAAFMILGNRCTRNCKFCAVGVACLAVRFQGEYFVLVLGEERQFLHGVAALQVFLAECPQVAAIFNGILVAEVQEHVWPQSAAVQWRRDFNGKASHGDFVLFFVAFAESAWRVPAHAQEPFDEGVGSPKQSEYAVSRLDGVNITVRAHD